MISQDSLHILTLSMYNSLTSTVVSNWFKFQTLELRARSSKSVIAKISQLRIQKCSTTLKDCFYLLPSSSLLKF